VTEVLKELMNIVYIADDNIIIANDKRDDANDGWFCCCPLPMTAVLVEVIRCYLLME
jgi:hypothetical protein